MNGYQLSLFSENLGELLEKGVALPKALEIASGSMVRRTHHRFAQAFATCLLAGGDLQQALSSFAVPPFYLAMLHCGQRTGQLPEALKRAAHFLQQLTPLKARLRRCLLFSFLAYAFSIVIRTLFWSVDDLWVLLVCSGIVFLPVFWERLKFWRDALLAKLPFTGTWLEQL